MASLLFNFSLFLIVSFVVSTAHGIKEADSPKAQEKAGEEKLQRRSNWFEVKEEGKENKSYDKKKDNYREEEKDYSSEEYGPAQPSYEKKNKYSSREEYGPDKSSSYKRNSDNYGKKGRNDYEEEYRGSYERSGYEDNDYTKKESEGYGSEEYKSKEKGYGEDRRKSYSRPEREYQEKRSYGTEEKKYGDNYKSGGGYTKKKTSEYSPFSSGYAHTHDTHYCSIHGSFALALPTYSTSTYSYGEGSSYKKEEGGYDGKEGYGQETGYGEKKEGYGKSDNYGSGQKRYRKKVVRHHTRQFCRYAAAYSYKACKFCCKVVARSANTSPDEIVAAIFAFDPARPSSNGAGIGYDSDSYDQQKEKYSASNSKYQCVCCAPKFKY